MTTKGIAICFIAAMVAAALAYRLGFEVGSHARSEAYPEIKSVTPAESQNADAGAPAVPRTPDASKAQQTESAAVASADEGASQSDDTSGHKEPATQADTRPHSKQHLDEYELFEQGFAEEDTDWQAQTYISDFIELHEWRDDIQLYKLSCSNVACVMDGRMTGDHRRWEEVVNQMRNQEWWAYSGTSSTSSTDDDGVTYFRVFMNKQP